MFQFEKISDFDFNRIYESTSIRTFGLSLDDFDEDDDMPIIHQKSKQKHSDYFEFDIFLHGKIFPCLEQEFDINNKNSKTEPQRYTWKRVNKDDGAHYVAYIYSLQTGKSKNYEFQFYIDLNVDTYELLIGNCSSFAVFKYFNISYPLIKICEEFNDGPVYIADIYVDMAYSYKETPEEIINKIEIPDEFKNVKGSISLYRCIWNKTSYYYPMAAPNKNSFTDILPQLKIPHNFIEHLSGFKNTFNGAEVYLYYNAFESFEDFRKLVVLFCEQGAKVITEFNFQFIKENYEDLLVEFKELINEKKGIEIEQKNQMSAIEEKCKEKIQNMFSKDVIEHFESINQKAPNLLSTKTMFKERKSNDPYRKFDLPIIDLILKDNGIDVDKLVEKYETEFLDNLYKFINLLDEHFDRIHCRPITKYQLFQDIFTTGELEVKYACTEKTNNTPTDGFTIEVFDGLTKEEVQLLKKLMTGLKVLQTDDQHSCQADVSRLNNKSEDTIRLANAVIRCFGGYRYQQIGDIQASKNSTESEDIHAYNKFALLQRFVYLLNILVVDDRNKEIEKSGDGHQLSQPMPLGAYAYNYNYIKGGYGYSGSYVPLRVDECPLKINTYAQLYKFIKMIAYIIENGYNITIPNLGCCSDREKNLILSSCGEPKYEIDYMVNNEFNYDNKPNVDLLNTTSLEKMFATIFKNIDKKL